MARLYSRRPIDGAELGDGGRDRDAIDRVVDFHRERPLGQLGRFLRSSGP